MKSDWPGAFLAINWELDFSQASSFHRMLMTHKNFHFTSFSDRTNDKIFLKSPKTLLFCLMGFFKKKKNSAVTHNHIWVPNTMPSFRKN